MSNIYIQEPPTSGKVLLETSVGDVDIELWSREAPKACRNFVQLCLEGYYNGTIFHRVVKGFIGQGGDPTGTGTGGDSIYGAPFKDEFHSRLRFVRRGLVAMANAGKDDNGSQFFFTLGACPELQNKHTIFGKVTGDTLYNILKLEECIVDIDDRPRYPHKITKAKVLQNPFTDIIPRDIKKEAEKKTERKSGSKATKNFKLLSFGDEAEEDEEEVNEISKGYRGKSKSSHDLTDDPALSSVPAVGENLPGDKRPLELEEIQVSDDTKKERVDHVKKRLKKEKSEEGLKKEKPEVAPNKEASNDEKPTVSKADEIRKEVNKLKKELSQAKKKEEADSPTSNPEPPTEEKAKDEEKPIVNDVVENFSKETEKYKEKKKKQKKKGSEREAQTMALLAKFQAKLHSAREKFAKEDEQDEVSAKAPLTKATSGDKEEDEEDEDETKWLAHTLHFETHEAKVKDANMNDEDTFEIFDPRNPINQRRREASKQAMRNKQR